MNSLNFHLRKNHLFLGGASVRPLSVRKHHSVEGSHQRHQVLRPGKISVLAVHHAIITVQCGKTGGLNCAVPGLRCCDVSLRGVQGQPAPPPPLRHAQLRAVSAVRFAARLQEPQSLLLKGRSDDMQWPHQRERLLAASLFQSVSGLASVEEL